MKDSIIVTVTELRSLIQDVRRSGCDYVRVSIEEPLTENGETIPAELVLSGCRKDDLNTWPEFESLYAVENEDELEQHYNDGMHMSSNMF